jgi:ABC-type uncharacterized transport system permease subunit
LSGSWLGDSLLELETLRVNLVETAILSLTLLVYLAGITASIAGTARRSNAIHRTATALVGLGWLLHLAALVRRGFVTGNLPLSNSAEFLLVLAWVVVALYLAVWFRWRVHAAGLVLPPLGAAMTAAAIGLIPGAGQPISQGAQGWFVIHTTASTMGLAALGVAFAMSLIYLTQDRALKSKRSLRILERLPSLHTCDRIGFQAVLVGFPLLTVGIVTGIIWNLIERDQVPTSSAKVIFPLVAWVLFAILLFARKVWGYRGRRSAYLTIAGFALGLLTILGIAR